MAAEGKKNVVEGEVAVETEKVPYEGIVRNAFAIIFLVSVVVFRGFNPKGITYAQVGDFISIGLNHKFTINAILYNEYMESAVWTIRSGYPVISILDLCGSITTCLSYRKSITSSKSWFESLVSCTLMQFGGTTLTGILLGQTPSWILSHSAFPALLLAWWLTFFSPFDCYYKTINQIPIFLFFVGIGGAISSGHAVTSWGLDKAAYNLSHVNHIRISQSVLTCIACGTLSASGGGLIANCLKFFDTSKSYTLTVTPSFFTPGDYTASSTANRAFLLSCIYFVLLNQVKEVYCNPNSRINTFHYSCISVSNL
jgi:uncharacterized membrane protein YeiH